MFNIYTNKRGNGAVPAATAELNQKQPNAASMLSSEQEERIQSRIDALEAERLELIKTYPDFDIEEELKNPKFSEYVLILGLPLEDAYFLIHRDEVIENAVNDAVDRIASRRGRIVENGASKSSPAIVKKNPKELSDKEVDEIIDRVRNGEKISF